MTVHGILIITESNNLTDSIKQYKLEQLLRNLDYYSSSRIIVLKEEQVKRIIAEIQNSSALKAEQ